MAEWEGTYKSVWDDGATVVCADCYIDLDKMRIIGWIEGTKRYEGKAPVDDGELEALTEELVEVDDVAYTAMSDDDFSFGLENPHEYDKYGNGIVVYDAPYLDLER